MKTILALTDFSENSKHAVDYACSLANYTHAQELILLYAYETIPIYDSGEAGSLAFTMEQSLEIEAAHEQALKKMKTYAHNQLHNGTVLKAVIVNDTLTSAVNELHETNHIDVVVMGLKGKNNIEHIVAGSNTIKAIENFDCPVVMVPKNACVSMPENIVLATDFYETERPGLLKIMHNFLMKFNPKIIAIHKYRADEKPEIIQKRADKLQQALSDYHFEMHYINADQSLAVNINEFAQKKHCSLIVCLHKKRGFLSGFFHKSATRDIAWHSNVPMLVYHIK